MKHSAVFLSLILLSIFTALTVAESVWGASVNVHHVAVLQFRPSGTSSAHAALTGNYVEMELLQKKEIVLLERGQVKKNYPVREANRYSCQDSSCAVLAGRELSADYVVIGDVVRDRRFTIKARIVSVRTEKIVFSCSVRYNREDDARGAAAKIAGKIVAGLRDITPVPVTSQDDTGKVTGKPLNIDIFTGLDMFRPLGRLNDLVGIGPGVNCGVMISGIPFKGPELLRGITAGFDTGFFYSRGRINSGDSGIFVPFSFSLGYPLLLVEGIYFVPVVSLGFTYLRFHHAAGDGFDMEDNSSTWAVDPHSRMMLIFWKPLTKEIRIELSTGLWVLMESPSPPCFITARLGLSYRFDSRYFF